MSKNYNRRTEKDYGLLRKTFYLSFLYLVVIPVAKLMYNIKVEGRENVPAGSHYIYASNHVSYLDPPLLTYATGGRFIAYMAKQELFDAPNLVLRTLVRWLGAFAVNRDKPEIATFKTVKAIFNTKDWALGIFPQGGIRKDTNKIENIHKGFVLFAKKFKADIVPVAICGYDGYAKRLFEKHLTMKVGKPISYELPEDEIVNLWVRQICEFTGFEPGDEYKNIINTTEEKQPVFK